jgi:hypothetical protein
MKKLLSAVVFMVALGAAFAFQPAAAPVKKAKFADIILYEVAEDCPAVTCGDYSGALCTGLFKKKVSCSDPYTGAKRRQ